ncbi:hypothetical protein ACVWZZ_003233 [Bradyrhizobium sp. LM6.10]|jgi:hypothetical protein
MSDNFVCCRGVSERRWKELSPKDDPNGGSHLFDRGPGQGHIAADEAGQMTIMCSRFTVIGTDRKDLDLRSGV